MPSQDPVFDSAFQTRLLHPRYWLSWLALGVLGVLAYVPPRLRDKLADALAPLVLKISKKQVYIARTNLAICFKEQSEAERDAILMTSMPGGPSICRVRTNSRASPSSVSCRGRAATPTAWRRSAGCSSSTG